MYLTYDEYITMGGDTLEETAFNQLEFEARDIIDWWTFNRLQRESDYPEAVKRCMFKLITMINNRQQILTATSQPDNRGIIHAGIMTESNDGVSVSYNTLSARESINSLQKEIETTVHRYLVGIRNSLGHKLLYRGIYPDE